MFINKIVCVICMMNWYFAMSLNLEGVHIIALLCD